MLGLSGDILAVFGIWVGGTMTAAVGALSTTGRIRIGLWIAAGIFAAASVSVVLTAHAVPWGALLPLGYAVMPPTVVGVVALMLRSKRSPAVTFIVPDDSQALETEAHEGEDRSAMLKREHKRYFVPDTLLPNAFGYLASSTWARDHNANDAALERELRDKLHSGELLAFGRTGTDGNLDPIFLDVWQSVRLNPHTGNMEAEDGTPMYFGIQFNSNRLARLWPTWRDNYGL